MQICFASHNDHKVKEINAIVPKNINIVGLKEIGIDEEIAETGTTLEQNSEIKARNIFEKISLPVFADDSGLLVHSLDNEPGVYSARYAGPQKDDDQNMDLLLRNLGNEKDRSATFQTVISYIDESGDLKQFKGEIKGTITVQKKGTNGFGYDPIFKPDGYDLTFAELSSEEKNKISHRSRAVQMLLDFLQNNYG